MYKLLLDECISWRVAKYLEEIFDEVLHVDNAGLGNQPRDRTIYNFATHEGYTILTKDDDFLSLALLSGNGSKVIRLLDAQLPVRILAERFLAHKQAVDSFLNSKEQIFLLSLAN